MSLPNDLLFGRIAVEQGFVTEGDVEECLAEQAATGDRRPLGELLLARGTITRRQMDAVAALQQQRMATEDPLTGRRREDSLFGRLAWRMGMLRQEDLNFALRQQAERARRGAYLPLGSLLVQEGYLTEEQMQSILEVQRKAILYCPECQVLYTIKGLAGKDVLGWLSTLRCPRCKDALVEPGEEVPAEAQWVVLPLEGLPIRAPSTTSPTPPATQHPTRPIILERARAPDESLPRPVPGVKGDDTTVERKPDRRRSLADRATDAAPTALPSAGPDQGPEAATSEGDVAGGAEADADAPAAEDEEDEGIPARVAQGPVTCTCPVCEGDFVMEPDKFGRVRCAGCRVWFLAR